MLLLPPQCHAGLKFYLDFSLAREGQELKDCLLVSSQNVGANPCGRPVGQAQGLPLPRIIEKIPGVGKGSKYKRQARDDVPREGATISVIAPLRFVFFAPPKVLTRPKESDHHDHHLTGVRPRFAVSVYEDHQQRGKSKESHSGDEQPRWARRVTPLRDVAQNRINVVHAGILISRKNFW